MLIITEKYKDTITFEFVHDKDNNYHVECNFNIEIFKRVVLIFQCLGRYMYEYGINNVKTPFLSYRDPLYSSTISYRISDNSITMWLSLNDGEYKLNDNEIDELFNYIIDLSNIYSCIENRYLDYDYFKFDNEFINNFTTMINKNISKYFIK